MVSLEFFIDIILPIALWPWCRLSLLTKMSTREFPGGKCGRCVRLTTLPPPCAIVMKSGNLNFLETSEPLQACNRTALPLLTGYITLVCVQKEAKVYTQHPTKLLRICTIFSYERSYVFTVVAMKN